MRPAPFFPDPKIPLRDVLRGAASIADGTHHALGPAAKMLPEPLRAGLSAAFRSLRSTGKRLISAPLSMAEIAQAARFVQGASPERAAAETTAVVIGHAWSHLEQALGPDRPHPLLSETLLAQELARLPQGAETPGMAAARLVRAVLGAGVIGAAPGLYTHLSAEEKADTTLALLAIVVWLLSDRCPSLAEEDRLVDLALALLVATRDEALEAVSDEVQLAGFITRASDHL
jgi:hypothetical protein